MATNVKRKKKKAEVMAEDGSMTLTGHLKELRNRLIICAVVFVVGVVVSLAYADRLIDLLTAMGRDYYEFVSIAPQEKLMQYFRVSILAGVVVTVPLQVVQEQVGDDVVGVPAVHRRARYRPTARRTTGPRRSAGRPAHR